MLLRAENVDIYTIALWLGHESTKSTEIYLHADNKLKQQAIDRTAPTGTPPGRYKPPDQLLAFLEEPLIMLNASPSQTALSRQNLRHRTRPQHNRTRDIHPGVTVSRHRALLIQSSRRWSSIASGPGEWGRVSRLRSTTPWLA